MHDQTGASHASAPATTASRSHAALLVLYLLDAFVLGGLVALMAVAQVLKSILGRLVSIEAGQEILNVQDHLFPYYVAYIVAFVVLALLTLGAQLLQAWRTTRKIN